VKGNAVSIRISFSTGTFYHRRAAYSLALARDAGFDGVELVLGHEYLLAGIDPVRRASVERGVPVLSVHPPFFPFPGWPRSIREAVPLAANAARNVGAELSIVHTTLFINERTLTGHHFETAIKRGQEAALGKAVITLENSQYARRARRFMLDDLSRLVAYARAHQCGITFDTCHAGANGEDLLKCAEILGDAVVNIHLSDATFHANKPVTHLMPGEGELPLREFIGALVRNRYEGLITLELHPSQTGLMGRGRALERLKQARVFVEDAIRDAQAKTEAPVAARDASLA